MADGQPANAMDAHATLPIEATPEAPPSPVEVVLDTNVVLDWLVFDDAAMRPVGRLIESCTWRWVLSPVMRDEIADVLGRPAITARVGDQAGLLRRIASLGQLVAEPASVKFADLVCADPDDQPFIDLAVARAVPLLLTRDKALLALTLSAGRIGVRVLTPADYAGSHGA